MAIKIELKDVLSQLAAASTDMALVSRTSDGAARLVAVSELGGVSGATGIRLTSPDNGHTYAVVVRIVDGVEVLGIEEVSGTGQFTSIFCADNATTYELSVTLVDGKPTLKLTAL